MSTLNKRLRRICEKNPIYHLSLWNNANPDFTKIAPDPWPANKSFDMNLLSDPTLWEIDYIQSFEWMREFKNDSDFLIRAKIRDMIVYWINTFHKVLHRSWLNWDADVTGYRVWNWIALFDFYGLSGSDAFRKKLSKSLCQQAQHLMRVWDDSPDPSKKFKALKGIIGFLSITHPSRIHKFLPYLEDAASKQLLEDGGHISKSSQQQLFLLRDLVDIRSCLSMHNIENDTLRDIIVQVAPIVRLFRHGDGSLSRFGQDTALKPALSTALIDMCLSLSDVSRRPPCDAPFMGYDRCVNKSGIIIFSRTPQKQDDLTSGLFGFEWSYDRQMIFENVETIVEQKDQSYLRADPSESTKVEKSINDDYTALYAEYRKDDFSYTTHLFVSGETYNIRGENKICSSDARFMSIRFVLSPDIEVVTGSKTSKSIILKLSVHNINKLTRITTLQFSSSGCEDLIYQPHAIVIYSAGPSAHIKWSCTLNL